MGKIRQFMEVNFTEYLEIFVFLQVLRIRAKKIQKFEISNFFKDNGRFFNWVLSGRLLTSHVVSGGGV